MAMSRTVKAWIWAVVLSTLAAMANAAAQQIDMVLKTGAFTWTAVSWAAVVQAGLATLGGVLMLSPLVKALQGNGTGGSTGELPKPSLPTPPSPPPPAGPVVTTTKLFPPK